MLLLNATDVRGLLGGVDLTQALEEAFKEEARGQVDVPPRLTADAHDGRGWLRIGPAFFNGSGYMGFKAMNRRPGIGILYMVMIYSMESGAPVALMDANNLTTARTSAVNALGTHLLARPETETVGIVGAGVQANALLDELLKLRTIKQVLVYSPREGSRSAFAREAEQRHDVSAEPVSSVKEAVSRSDTVLLAFRASAEPVLTSDMLRPGMHVTGLSSVRPEAREIDEATWSAADVVVVDSPGSVFQSGDGRSIIEAGQRASDFPTISQLIIGATPGRTAPEQITLFKSSGDSLQDVAAGVAVYEAARDNGVGTDFGDFPEVKPYD